MFINQAKGESIFQLHTFAHRVQLFKASSLPGHCLWCSESYRYCDFPWLPPHHSHASCLTSPPLTTFLFNTLSVLSCHRRLGCGVHAHGIITKLPVHGVQAYGL